MAVPSLPFVMFKAALLSLLVTSSVSQECNVRPEETLPGAAVGTGLLQTKPAGLALEKTGFEESMLKAMGKLEEELKDLKAKDSGLVEELAELKNEDAGLKEELARLESSPSRSDAALAEVPPVPRGRPDLQGIFAQHQNASERRSSCKKAAVLPLASLVGGNISDDSKTKKVEVHRSNAGCPSGEVKLFDFQPAGATQSCCREVPPKCLREGERWEPINMPGQSRTDTENWQDCQRRCLKVTGCSHFSYWQDGGCHLQDSSATMVVAPAYVTSGPPTCEMQVCAGCAFSSGNSCQRCAGGFIWRDGQCTACTSSGGWLSVDGRSCMQLAASDCSDEKVRGQSSNEACCQCGGGVVTPTPFSYPNSRWSLDSNIVMKPEPRTALRYTVDSKCELAAHNLTMDSSTGEISYMSGRSKPVEAFSFECEITAHQATGVSLASVVTVAADVLSYSSATLLFHGDGQEELPLTTGSGWSKFETWTAEA